MGLSAYVQVVSEMHERKKSASHVREADSLNLNGKFPALVEKVPHTRANQVLPKIAALVRVDLGTRIVEVVVFDKNTPLRI
jgi:hypothetical protein